MVLPASLRPNLLRRRDAHPSSGLLGGELYRDRLFSRSCFPHRPRRSRPLVQPGDARRVCRVRRRHVAAASPATTPPSQGSTGRRRGPPAALIALLTEDLDLASDGE